jgi:hypothetical protein
MKSKEANNNHILKGETLTAQSILNKIRKIYKEHYQNDDIDTIKAVLDDLMDLFSGNMKGYLKCDTGYHDIKHTLQVVPPFIGILDGWNKSKKRSKIPKDLFDRGIIAVLLHDTGYIKSDNDIEGTGAKYTFVHTQRSADFAISYLSKKGFDKDTINSIKNIIMYTGVVVDYNKLPFTSEEEKIVGYALGTSDLLGQMSADDYPEKLPTLYREFEESYHFEGKDKLRKQGMTIFDSADDMIKNTPSFYESAVKERFKNMGSLYTYLTYHFDDERNHYIEAIEENIKKIKRTSSVS